MSGDLIYISVVILVCLSFFIAQLIKTFGLYTYDDPEENKEYQKWLLTQGPKKKVISIIVILFLLTTWIWAMFNF